MKKILKFLEEKRYIFFALAGVLLISMTLKTQAVILTYGDEYALRMEYTVYGYCIRASASLKATEPAVQNEVYIGNSFDTSVLKAIKQMELISDTPQTVGVLATGFPRNVDKLEAHLLTLISESGRQAEILK